MRMWGSLSSDSWEAHTSHSKADVALSFISIVFTLIYEVEFWLGEMHVISSWLLFFPVGAILCPAGFISPYHESPELGFDKQLW